MTFLQHLIPIVSLLLPVLLFITHLVLAISIYYHAKEFEHYGKSLLFVGPLVWAAITFLYGPFAVLIYYLVNIYKIPEKN